MSSNERILWETNDGVDVVSVTTDGTVLLSLNWGKDAGWVVFDTHEARELRDALDGWIREQEARG